MTQFAVYSNPSTARDIVFLVQIQSARLEQAATRLLIPLGRAGRSAPLDHPLTPHLHVQGLAVYADPFRIGAILRVRLGDILTVLEEPDQDRIIRAIDEMISRA